MIIIDNLKGWNRLLFKEWFVKLVAICHFYYLCHWLFFLCKYTKSIHTDGKEIARPCIRFEKNRIQGFLFYDGLDKRRENGSERNRLTFRGGTTNLELKLRLWIVSVFLNIKTIFNDLTHYIIYIILYTLQFIHIIVYSEWT